MKRKKLNIGVVGIGYLGKYHLEKFINNKQCDTKWVVDTNLDNIKRDMIRYKNLQTTRRSLMMLMLYHLLRQLKCILK